MSTLESFQKELTDVEKIYKETTPNSANNETKKTEKSNSSYNKKKPKSIKKTYKTNQNQNHHNNQIQTDSFLLGKRVSRNRKGEQTH